MCHGGAHGARCDAVLEQCVSVLNSGQLGRFTLLVGLKVLAAVLDSIVVAWLRGGLVDTPHAAATGFCACAALHNNNNNNIISSKATTPLLQQTGMKRLLEQPPFVNVPDEDMARLLVPQTVDGKFFSCVPLHTACIERARDITSSTAETSSNKKQKKQDSESELETRHTDEGSE